MVGSMPRRDGMERKDLLKANVAIFKSQGAALDKFAKKTVKVKNKTKRMLKRIRRFLKSSYNNTATYS